ncbi:uncharacterized protein ltc4s [Clupea harengus]|uniref:Leukotriene C4 synthase n=1 Tax=Clupea harengus TaxID=7950 RepID=A0A6P8EST5_CLUHA|nr:uncharacterized protein ltc4s [Clupea harengus]
MNDQVVCIAGVTVLGILEQAYFSLQVIYARRKFSVSPPSTAGPPEFERIFRAQANCSEYFPVFVASLWISGIFFSQGVTTLLGLLYLYGRYQYFCGYSESSLGRWDRCRCITALISVQKPTDLWCRKATCAVFHPHVLLIRVDSDVHLDTITHSVFILLFLDLTTSEPFSSLARLKPLYFSAKVQWVLIGLGAVGVLGTMSRLYLGLDFTQYISQVLL